MPGPTPPELDPEPLPEPKMGVSDLPYPASTCFCALIPLTPITLLAFSFLRARLPALVAEKPPALMLLMMLALVKAVEPVAFVLLD